jgi:hypothetical protein
MDSVLVACPTARVKDYALDSYLRAYNSFNYDNKNLLMVDTSPIGDNYDEKLIKDGVETVVRYECSILSLPYTITRVWEEVLIPYAWETNVDWVFHLESDVICPPNTIDYLLSAANTYGASIVSHSYGCRSYQELKFTQSIGCIMFKRSVFKPGDSLYDYAERFVREIPYSNMVKGVELVNILDIEHMEDTK